MKTMLRTMVVCGLLVAPGLLFAQAERFRILLDKIEALDPSAGGDDHLYIAVTDYPYQQDKALKPSQKRYPDAPLHWLVPQLSRVEHLVLYEDGFPVGHAAEVHITLADQDYEPWDVDDEIGTVEIFAVHQSGDVPFSYYWSVPNTEHVTIEEQRDGQLRCLFKAGASQYRLTFSVSGDGLEGGR